MGFERLQALGVDPYAVAIPMGHYAVWGNMHLRDRIASLTQVGEACSFKGKREWVAAARERGEWLSALEHDYDMVDEKNHVRFGARWLPEILKRLEDRARPRRWSRTPTGPSAAASTRSNATWGGLEGGAREQVPRLWHPDLGRYPGPGDHRVGGAGSERRRTAMVGYRSHAQTRRAILRRSAFGAGLGAAAGALPGCAGQQPAAPASAGSVELWQLYANSPAAPQLKELFQRKHLAIRVEVGQRPGRRAAPRS